MVQYNLIALYQQAFGYVGFPGPPIETEKRVDLLDKSKEIDVYSEPEADYYSSLGTPIFFPLIIDGWKFPNEPLISVRRSKKIIETVLTDIDGAVNEEISLGNWQIDIKGIVVNEVDDSFPKDEVRKIRQLCDRSGALKVYSPLLAVLGINQVILKTPIFKAVAGFQSQQAYQIHAISDRPIELVIKEGV